MANVRVSFKVLKGVTPDHMSEGKVKPEFKYVGTHMILNIKMDCKFTHKDRLLQGGHNTSPPFYITNSIFVTRESVILAFLIAGLNDFGFFNCDIGNAYINSLCRGEIGTEAGS